MILKNNAKRLITINGAFVNGERVKSFKLLPGNNPAVDVPDELCDNTFVESLLADGSLIKVGESEKVESTVTSSYSDMNKTDLKSLAENMGIDVKSAWSKDDIIAEIEKLDAE